MAVWFDVNINSRYVGEMQIIRMEELDISDPAKVAHTINHYTVLWKGNSAGVIEHRYGDGIMALISKATGLLAGE